MFKATGEPRDFELRGNSDDLGTISEDLLVKRLEYAVLHRDRCERSGARISAEMYQIGIEKLCAEIRRRDEAGHFSPANYAHVQQVLS